MTTVRVSAVSESGKAPASQGAATLTDAQARVLDALASEGEVVVARTGTDTPAFRSRLRAVDPQRRFVVLERAADAAANAALMRRERVDFFSEWGEWKIEFTAEAPEAGESDCIRIGYPLDLTVIRRRMMRRTAVPERVPLRCVARDAQGALWFSARIVDIGQGGICLLDDLGGQGVALEPGNTLIGYRIEGPDRAPVSVDLEVRHTESVRLADGRTHLRVGCRFTQVSIELAALVADRLVASD